MPTIRRAITVPAGGVNDNALAGSPFEFVGQAAQVEIAAVRETAPAGVGTIEVTFGPQVQLEPGPLATEQAAGLGPLLPDNILVSDIAAPGDRLRVGLRETGGAADMDVVLLVRVEPV